ncbi:juvenile hormone acid O-methyltransferase-like [Macrosteles quadrilineatus]|uniref:juvenile hormone acid O-methyltransferase-like n=1 Tax=Macrosteles quadrilineatus TaxID=74068 RepID=UPI0023E2DA4B|nr:juvenile hormone acid O-methyltransferase-like [Macrosteles quadrilineatus]
MENAELYLSYNAVQKRDAEMILGEFSSRLSWSENEDVLDIGCGPGDVSTEVLLPHLPKNATLVGVDLSPNMVEYANEKYANDRISFKTLDIATKDIKKQLPEKHFSKIFSCHCLHWVQDQRQLGENLSTLLKPGGEFLAVMTPSSQLFLALKLLSQFQQFQEYCQDVDQFIPPLHHSQDPAEDLRRTLTSQGLEVIVCEQRLNPVTYPNMETMKRAFEAFNPFVKRMPEDIKEQYLAIFEVLVRQRVPITETGEVNIENPILVVYARKPTATWAFSHHSRACSSIC